jgi:tricarboxylate carrier
MSGYVPFNSPILAGMLMNNPSMPQLIFFQWLNQSHNACVNYANRNASKPTEISRFLKGYTSAVTAAISLSVGLTIGIKKASFFTPSVRSRLLRFVPLPAVMTASTLNVVLMRIHELDEGIDVMDKTGRVVGNSKLAAKNALQDMAVTRMVLPVPLLLFPSISMGFIEKTAFLKRNPRLSMPINILLCTLSFFVTLPATLAIFPQMSEIKTENLEEEIRKNCSDETLFYNKGL